MSSSETQNPGNQAAQQGQQPYFPPPPPGPPPAQTAQPQGPKHSNETPIPDYNIPSYNPAHPQFAAPPIVTDDDIYDATPTDEKPPKFPHSFGGHHQHKQDGDEQASKKKPNKLAAFGAAFSSKVAGPVNALAHKFGSEGFLPESLDKECEKAARILKGFCKDGIYSDITLSTTNAPAPGPTDPSSLTTTATAASGRPTTPTAPKSPSNASTKKPRVLLTIPSKVISRAVGLAIFTAVRVGFQATGSSGSGILIARLPDGRGWSPPSGIQITSIGAGFVAGVDIYDCVIVINTREALEMFTKTRLSLGSEVSVTAGPVGVGGAVDWGVQQGEKEKGKGKEKDGVKQEQGGGPAAPPPLSADNTQFQTAPVSEADQLEPEDRAKLEKQRKPSPFRETIRKPVYSYVKSRGLYAGIGIDGTVVAERENANTKFYGAPVSVHKILKGEVPAQGPPGMWPVAARTLIEVLRGAEGWRGQQGQQPEPGRPVTPIFDPTVVTGTGPAPATGVGAPQATWVPPPVHPPNLAPGVTTGMQNLSIGATAGPSTFPPPPPGVPPPTAGASAKAAEAATEAARAQPASPPPPMYTEQHAPEDLPPAYVEDEGARLATGDSKTGRH